DVRERPRHGEMNVRVVLGVDEDPARCRQRRPQQHRDERKVEARGHEGRMTFDDVAVGHVDRAHSVDSHSKSTPQKYVEPIAAVATAGGGPARRLSGGTYSKASPARPRTTASRPAFRMPCQPQSA